MEGPWLPIQVAIVNNDIGSFYVNGSASVGRQLKCHLVVKTTALKTRNKSIIPDKCFVVPSSWMPSSCQIQNLAFAVNSQIVGSSCDGILKPKMSLSKPSEKATLSSGICVASVLPMYPGN